MDVRGCRGVWALLVVLAACAAAPNAGAVTPESVIAGFGRDCARDRGALWGRSLCGPFLFVAEDGRLIANAPDAEGRLRRRGRHWIGDANVGEAPPNTNTAAVWAGVNWAIVHTEAGRTAAEYARLSLHESFHRIQPEIALDFADAATGAAEHLDEQEGRFWMRLSLRALAAAAEARNRRQAESHLRNALVMSMYRHQLFPAASEAERLLEMHEGLAEYTGWRLARGVSGAALARFIREQEQQDNLARSFMYVTGPAWGYALDRAGVSWRTRMGREGPGFVDVARTPLGLAETVSEAEAIAAAVSYGYETLAAEEARRAIALAETRARHRARFIDGPRVVVPLTGAVNFDPRGVVSMGEDGLVYSTLNVSAAWGSLSTEHGALVRWSNREAAVARFGDPESPVWQTDQWRIELNDGWRYFEHEGSIFVAPVQRP